IATLPERIMAALREGKTLNNICSGRLNKRYTPGQLIASRERFHQICAADPEFACEATALLDENTKAANAKKGAFKRNQTHCKFGHPLSGPNLLVEGKTKFRRCRICMARRAASPRPPTADQIRRATAALNAGQTITRICWGIVDGKKCHDRIMSHPKW